MFLSLTAMFNTLILLNTLYAFASTKCLLIYIYIYIYIYKETLWVSGKYIKKIGVQPDLNVRRQRLAARLSQMVTAKPLGQPEKAGVVASFVTLARHDSKSGGTQSPPIHYGR